MAVTRMEMTVHYEDGTSTPVVSDQRDVVVFERVQKYGFVNALEDMPITLFRFLAYQALKRTGCLVPATATREAWEATVIEVEIDDEDTEADPGQPEASGGSSSTSPTRRAPASGTSRAARTTGRKTSQR